MKSNNTKWYSVNIYVHHETGEVLTLEGKTHKEKIEDYFVKQKLIRNDKETKFINRVRTDINKRTITWIIGKKPKQLELFS